MPLSNGERVGIIRSIFERLMSEDWPLLDLTLDQFGLETSEVWNSGKDEYIIHSLKGADDSTLVELGRYVGLDLARDTAPAVDPPFWEANTFRLFVSHLAIHRAFAAEFQEELALFGVSAFVAHNDIEPTLEWQAQIEIALATCDGMVALLHEGFHSSNWTDQEIGYVMGRGLPTFAVRLGEDPYGFIGRFQALNGNGKTAAALASEVFNSLRTNKQTAARMADVLVSLFERSGSFARAKERIGYLEELDVWKASFADRLRSAVKNNPQVSDSWGVPERVTELIGKHSS